MTLLFANIAVLMGFVADNRQTVNGFDVFSHVERGKTHQNAP